MKRCTKCGEEKELDAFFARKGATDGRMSSCKVCKTKAIYAWRDENRQSLHAYQREYRKRPNAIATLKVYAARPEIIEREKAREKARSATANDKVRKAAVEKLETVAAYRKSYRKTPEVKERAKIYKQRPEVRKATAAKQRARRISTPFRHINAKMSTAVGQAIRKNNRSWKSLVGYTAGELMAHLEKQFLPGMTWGNMRRWHIDHILPIASFSFSSADDPEFKACWSLGNLRPMWAKENISKGDKILFLL